MILTLADGTIINVEGKCGPSYIYGTEPLDETMFTDEVLRTVIVTNDDGSTITLNNLTFGDQQFYEPDGKYHFCFYQLSDENVKQQEFLKMFNAMSAFSMSALQVVAESIPDEELLTVSHIVPKWEIGKIYTIGMVCKYNDELYRVVQNHTSQADWTPDISTSLYSHVIIDEDTGIEEWIQPTGAHDAYNLGAEVMHNGIRWKSVVDNNVWEPGVYGWEEVN